MQTPSSPTATTPSRSSTHLRELLLIIVGAFLQALAYSGFIAPNNIVPGGVYGITIALNALTVGVFDFASEGLPIGLAALLFNIPLLILATHRLGLKSGPKTVLTFVLISLFTDLIGSLLDYRAIIGDMILAACYGGAILGLGVFLIFEAGSTSAGTDVLGRVISSGRNIRLSTCIIIIDSIVVLFGLLVFKDISVPLYSWLTIFIYGRVVDFLSPENPKKALFIVTEQHRDVAKALLAMGVRGTLLHGSGMYAGTSREIIYIITERKQLPKIRKCVRSIDDRAFISTMDAGEDPLPIPRISGDN